MIENPPQSHWTIKFPIYGIVEVKLVITVAPQNDICPHGNTYPKNAVAMKIKKIPNPYYSSIMEFIGIIILSSTNMRVYADEEHWCSINMNIMH